MQKPHRPVRVNKLSRVLHRRIGQAIEIFETSGIPIAMVPCLHQCNVYIVRKVRVWRAQKCYLLVSAKTASTGRGQQTTPCHSAEYLASSENFRYFWVTGLQFPRHCGRQPWHREPTLTQEQFLQRPERLHLQQDTMSYGCTHSSLRKIRILALPPLQHKATVCIFQPSMALPFC